MNKVSFAALMNMMASTSRMTLRQKRFLCKHLRDAQADANKFVPREGLTLGQFCCCQVLNKNAKKRTSS